MPFKDPLKRKEYEAMYRGTHREAVRRKVRAHYHRHLDEERERSRVKHNPEQKMVYWRWARYRLRDSEYRALVEQYEGRCAICKRERPLQVDHDHNTKKVRGLLCGPCNRALGCFDENRDLLLKAADYLCSL